VEKRLIQRLIKLHPRVFTVESFYATVFSGRRSFHDLEDSVGNGAVWTNRGS